MIARPLTSCACLCGGHPYRGRYLPGHNARLQAPDGLVLRILVALDTRDEATAPEIALEIGADLRAVCRRLLRMLLRGWVERTGAVHRYSYTITDVGRARMAADVSLDHRIRSLVRREPGITIDELAAELGDVGAEVARMCRDGALDAQATRGQVCLRVAA